MNLDESSKLKIIEVVAKRQQKLQDKVRDNDDDLDFHPTNTFHDGKEDDVFLPPGCFLRKEVCATLLHPSRTN